MLNNKQVSLLCASLILSGDVVGTSNYSGEEVSKAIKWAKEFEKYLNTPEGG